MKFILLMIGFILFIFVYIVIGFLVGMLWKNVFDEQGEIEPVEVAMFPFAVIVLVFALPYEMCKRWFGSTKTKDEKNNDKKNSVI